MNTPALAGRGDYNQEVIAPPPVRREAERLEALLGHEILDPPAWARISANASTGRQARAARTTLWQTTFGAGLAVRF